MNTASSRSARSSVDKKLSASALMHYGCQAACAPCHGAAATSVESHRHCALTPSLSSLRHRGGSQERLDYACVDLS